MIKYIFSPLLFIFLFSNLVAAQEGCLEFFGRLKNENSTLDTGFTVTATTGNSEDRVISTTEAGGKYFLKLKLNREYTVRFSGRNYVAKRIIVNTTIPPKYEKQVWRSQLAIELFEKMDGINYDGLRDPISKIKFQDKRGEEMFTQDLAYAKKMQYINEDIKAQIRREKDRQARVKREVTSLSPEAKKILASSLPDKANADQIIKNANIEAESLRVAAEKHAQKMKEDAEKYAREKEESTEKAVEGILRQLDYTSKDPKEQARQIIFLAQQRAIKIIEDAKHQAADMMSQAGVINSSEAVTNLLKQRKLDYEGLKSFPATPNLSKEQRIKTLKEFEAQIQGKREDLARDKYLLELQKLRARTHQDSLLIQQRENEIKKAEQDLKRAEEELQKQKENIIRKDYEIRNRENMLISAGIVLVLLLLFLIIVVRNYWKIRKLNKILDLQNQEIDEKNTKIMSSLTYARRIQEAILPPKDVLTNYFDKAFLLFRPKDVVSGDFYWVQKYNNKIFFSVVDCTGHGVPGAFMSIIGNYGLNQAITEFNITTPSEILDRLNTLVSQTLHSGAVSMVNDGMDLALCAIDLDTLELEYSGAMNPLYVVRKKEEEQLSENGNLVKPAENDGRNILYEIRADKTPIGGDVRNREKFTNHKIQLKKGDSIYIFSDGFVDQFGGEDGKKFKYKPFRELLLAYQKREMKDFRMLLDTAFDSWRGTYEQIDDVCVIGVKF